MTFRKNPFKQLHFLQILIILFRFDDDEKSGIRELFQGFDAHSYSYVISDHYKSVYQFIKNKIQPLIS